MRCEEDKRRGMTGGVAVSVAEGGGDEIAG